MIRRTDALKRTFIRPWMVALLTAQMFGTVLAQTEVTFWYAWGGAEGVALEELITEFNASQSAISVRGSFVPIGDGERILATLAGGTPPELVTIWDWMVVPLGAGGALSELSGALEAAGVTADDYLPGIWDYGAYRGAKYGLPTTLNVYAFVWNKDVFTAAGLDPEVPPRTIAELDALTEQLTTVDNRGNMRRLGFYPNVTAIYMYAFGGQLYDPETLEITLDHPGNVAAFEWLAAYYRKFDINRIRRFQAGWGDMASPFNPFYRGQIAMQEGGQWEVLSTARHAPDLNWGVTTFPAPEGGRADVTPVQGSFWVVPAQARNKDAAIEFLLWLTAPAQSARFAAALANIPPRIEALESPAFADTVTSHMQVYLDMLLTGYVFTPPGLPVGLYLSEQLNQALASVQDGAMTAQEALETAQRNVLRELEKYE
ncbi:MAG: ABC transporter substrate-binding protein [Trueperaceae bacterium]|nr:ABC transporter substrate-binding protein [Trueperaceae bacterium]